MPRNVFLVANPAAGHGRGAKLLPAGRRAFAAVGAPKPLVTRGPGDEARCVWEALDAGADTLAILGGDGTLSKATGALLAARAGDRCRVLMLPGGSGNDFISTLAMRSRAWVEMAKLAVDGAATPVDCARLDGRHVLNVAGFGFDVAALRTLQRLGALGRLAGSALRYKLAAAKHIFGFRPMRADLDDGLGERALLLVAIANGRRYGGGILVAPNASVDDGLLDVVSIDDAPATERIALFQTAQEGKHISRGGVSVRREPAVTLRFDEPPAFQIDGELYQARRREVVAECVPGALRVITGPAVATAPAPGLLRSAASPAPAFRSMGRP
ncbi:MAG: YegS/Rv2252/BmrU family lipid kinase [Gemmatimonadaceae bacterium]|nr:YegS/Rv2252/BmrU family lipid kinase [Gemmatimonadaceae bacterium]